MRGLIFIIIVIALIYWAGQTQPAGSLNQPPQPEPSGLTYEPE